MEFHHQVATMTLIQAANFIKEQFDIPKTSEEIFNDFQNMVIEEYRNTIPLKPYARELVKWMKRDGYKVAVATANEIHLSEMVLERTALSNDHTAVDLLARSDKECSTLPDVTYLKENADKVKGLVITHGHEDHIGAIPYIENEVNMPIYATKLTMGLIEHKLREHGNINNVRRKIVTHGQMITLGAFRIEFIRTTHSIADAAATTVLPLRHNMFHMPVTFD